MKSFSWSLGVYREAWTGQDTGEMQEAHTHREGKVVQDIDKKIKAEVPEKVSAMA